MYTTSTEACLALYYVFLMWQTIPPLAPSSTAQIQALEHQSELPGIYFDMPSPRRRLGGYLERPALEPLIHQKVARPIPHQNLDPVPTPVQEDEDMPAQGIRSNEAPRRRRKPIEPPPCCVSVPGAEVVSG